MGEQFGKGRTITTIPFVSGSSDGTSDLATQMPELDLVVNAEYTKENSIIKRNGFTKETQLYNANISRIVNYKDNVYGFTKDGDVYRCTNGNTAESDSIIARAPTDCHNLNLPEFINKSEIVLSRLDTNITTVDIASTEKYDVIIYTVSTDVVQLLIKNRSDSSVVYNRNLSSNGAIECRATASIYTDGYVLVTWIQGGGLSGKVLNLNTASPTIGTTLNLAPVTYQTYDPNYDVCARTNGGWWITNYYNGSIYAQAIGHNGTNPTSLSSTEISDDGYSWGLSICETGVNGAVYIAAWQFNRGDSQHGIHCWTRSTQTLDAINEGLVHSQSGLFGYQAAPIVMIPHNLVTDEIFMYFNFAVEYSATYPANGIDTNPTIRGICNRVSQDCSVDGVCNEVKNLHAVTKGWMVDNKCYTWLADYVNRILYMVELCDNGGAPVLSYMRTITTACYSQTWAGRPTKLFTVSTLTNEYISGNRLFITPLIGEDLNNPNKDIRVGFNKLEWKNDTENMYQTEIVNGTMYIAGGLLMQYDGVEFTENNFIQVPNVIATKSTTTDADEKRDYGTYSYIMVYEYIDNAGLKHRSVPSNPVVIEINRTVESTTYFGDAGLDGYATVTGETIQNINSITVMFDDPDQPNKFYYYLDQLVGFPIIDNNGGKLYDVDGDTDNRVFEFPQVPGMYITFNAGITFTSRSNYTATLSQEDQKIEVLLSLNTQTYRYDSKAILSVYRTLKDGEIYYRMASWEECSTWDMDFGSTGLINNPIEVSVGKYKFTDITDDDVIKYNETLYSSPDGSGVLANDHPWGGVKGIKFHRNRLWMISAEKPNRIMYTKELEYGSALSYSLGFDLDFEEDIVGMSSHDETLMVFTKNYVYGVVGNGMDATGNPRSGELSVFKINGIPGCTTSRSIITTDIGTFYHSLSGGLKLITKSLNTVSIGDAISNYIDGNTVIRDVVDVSAYNKQMVLYSTNNSTYPLIMINYADLQASKQMPAARFSLWNLQTGLVNYDKLNTLFTFANGRLWMMEQYQERSTTEPTVSRLFYQNSYFYDQATTFYGEENVHYTFYIKTGYWNLGNDALKSVRNIQIAGNVTFAGIKLDIKNSNWSRDTAETETWQWTAINDLKTYDVCLTHHNWYRKGRAWQIEISDLEPDVETDSGEVELISLSFEHSDMKPGLRVGRYY